MESARHDNLVSLTHKVPILSKRLPSIGFLLFAIVFTETQTHAQISIGFRMDTDWGAGANVTFTITNSGASAIPNWTLEFDYASAISPYSHATLLSHVGNHHVLTNLSYAIIPANGALSFQCLATPGGLGSNQPGNYLFNGASVGGGGPQPLRIVTASLPDAGLGAPYSQTLAASGGTPPYSWNLASGSLPDGFNLGTNGLIAGTASA